MKTYTINPKLSRLPNNIENVELKMIPQGSLVGDYSTPAESLEDLENLFLIGHEGPIRKAFLFHCQRTTDIHPCAGQKAIDEVAFDSELKVSDVHVDYSRGMTSFQIGDRFYKIYRNPLTSEEERDYFRHFCG